MLTLITYDGRKKPENALEATVEQRDALFGSMVAYGGTYTYSGNRVEHHIDIWWNESWNGTTVIRSITRDGDRLVYVTEPFPDRAEKTKGKMVFTTLIWEKVR